MRRLELVVASLGFIAVVALLVALVSWAIQSYGDDSEVAETVSDSGLPPGFGKVSEVWDVLQERHIDREELDSGDIEAGAIKGILESLDDPHATYLNPDQFAIARDDFSGRFSGIGAEVSTRNGRIMIHAPMPDTPAEAAGLRPGDIILSIDGRSTDDLSLGEAVALVRGPAGTPVNLLVLHQDGGEPVTITIVRDNIRVRSVKFRSLVGGVGHLRISSFTNNTEDEVAEAIDTFIRRKSKGLVVDVRNNPGGLLNATVKVVDQFLDGGLVLYQLDSNGQRVELHARPGGIASEIPMVVLMNEYSGSGSEVFIGAIKDHERATTIGGTSFGKGSVSSFHQFSDGSGVYFTIARWYTPNGVLIEGEGIEPDFAVDVPEDSRGDPQLESAIEMLNEMIGRS